MKTYPKVAFLEEQVVLRSYNNQDATPHLQSAARGLTKIQHSKNEFKDMKIQLWYRIEVLRRAETGGGREGGGSDCAKRVTKKVHVYQPLNYTTLVLNTKHFNVH